MAKFSNVQKSKFSRLIKVQFISMQFFQSKLNPQKYWHYRRQKISPDTVKNCKEALKIADCCILRKGWETLLRDFPRKICIFPPPATVDWAGTVGRSKKLSQETVF